jgi:hypothetical protein
MPRRRIVPPDRVLGRSAQPRAARLVTVRLRQFGNGSKRDDGIGGQDESERSKGGHHERHERAIALSRPPASSGQQARRRLGASGARHSCDRREISPHGGKIPPVAEPLSERGPRPGAGLGRARVYRTWALLRISRATIQPCVPFCGPSSVKRGHGPTGTRPRYPWGRVLGAARHR